jgi:hypothetical protein
LKLLTRPQLLARITRLLPTHVHRARLLGALLANTAVADGGARRQQDQRDPGRGRGRDRRPHAARPVRPSDFLRELRAVLGDDVELEVMKEAPPTVTEPIASPLFDVIRTAGDRAGARRHRRAVHDPRLHRRPSTSTQPRRALLRLLAGDRFEKSRPTRCASPSIFHGHNERIPIAGLHWGAEVLDAVVREFAAMT